MKHQIKQYWPLSKSSMLLRFLVFAVGTLGGSFAQAAENGYDGQNFNNGGMNYNWLMHANRPSRGSTEKLNTINKINAAIKALREELQGIGEAAGSEKQDLIHEIKELEAFRMREVASMQGGFQEAGGGAFMRGFAGREWAALSDISPDKIATGVFAGVAFCFGEAMRGKIQDTLSTSFSDIWDFFIGGTIGGIRDASIKFWGALFHNSKKPFTVVELNRWERQINQGILDDLFKRAGDVERLEFRDPSQRLRGIEGERDPIDPLWAIIARDYADQLSWIAESIATRRKYYGPLVEKDPHNSESGAIKFWATRIESQLLNLRDTILDTGSLKEFAAPNIKALVPLLHQNLKENFSSLTALVGGNRRGTDPGSKDYYYKGGTGSNKNANNWGAGWGAGNTKRPY